LLPLKPICPATKARKDGTSIIFLQYCKSDEDKTILNTEIAIPPRYWNKKLRRVADDLPSAYGDYKQINLEIHRMSRIAEDIINYALKENYPDPVQFTKKAFCLNFDTAKLQTAAIKAPPVELRIG
jgi:hypothetical protein